MDEKRRETRRRKILQNQGNRMNKIIGTSAVEDTASKEAPLKKAALTETTRNTPEIHQTTAASKSASTQDLEKEVYSEVGRYCANAEDCTDNSNVTNQTVTSSLLEEQQREGVADGETKQAARLQTTDTQFWRFLLCLLAGILVRISLIYSFGQDYVQTSVYPFFAMEVAFLGYQRAVGMEVESASGGLGILSTLLTLLGIRSHILRLYNQLFGALSVVFSDFAVYCFAFILTHVVVVLVT